MLNAMKQYRYKEKIIILQCFYYWIISSRKPYCWFINVIFDGKYIRFMHVVWVMAI